MEQNSQPPTGIAKFLVKLPLYVKIGFGLIIVFGMVGNCAGMINHDENKMMGALAVFVIATILWACTRMLQEAFQSLLLLGHLKKWEDDQKKPPTPPSDDTPAT